jgi:peptide/nickel transport system substrate-binding protein
MKAVKIIGSFILIAFFLASCASTQVVKTVVVPGTPDVITATPATVNKSGGTLVWAVDSEPPGFNPILNDYGVEIVVYQLTSEPLTWGGENFPTDLQPILATSWSQSSDGLTWTIHLRQGVKWQDGTPFTADDVLFWAKAIQDPNTTGADWLRSRFSVNNQPFVFNKVDDYTLTITTAAPVPTLVNDICAPLIPAHYFQQNNISDANMVKDSFNTTKNIGTGPFQISSYVKGEAVTLTRNDNYWGGKPLLDSIQIRIIPDDQARVVALQDGEVDFEQVDPKFVPQLVGDSNIQLINKVIDMQDHYRLNVSKPTLKDNRTRQALFYALDRNAIMQAMTQGYGEVANSPFNPVVTAYVPQTNTYAYNVQKAQELLAEVGWVKGPDGVYVANTVDGVAKGTRFTLVLDVQYSGDLTAMTLAQSYWKALGIDATIRQIDPNVWHDENIGKAVKSYDVEWTGVGFIGDNGVNYNWLMASNPTDSEMSYENPAVNALFNQAKTTADVTQRDTYLKQAADIVWNDLPYLPIYYEKRVFAANTKVHFEDADWQDNMVGIFGKPGSIWIEK